MTNQPDPEKPIAYDAYQKLADHYSNLIDTKPHNAYYDRPAMLGLLPDINGKQVLDAGCGPGAYARELVARGATVTAIDMSDRMLELARERLSAEISAGRAKLLNVDMSKSLSMFDNDAFDLVNAPLCLDYISDWNLLFREFFRLVKLGGRVIFSCGHPAFDAEYFKTNDYFSVESVECIWRGFGINVRMPSYRRSLEEIISPVIAAGFVLERIHEPLPTEDFKKTDPARYQALRHRPGFLCVKARKQ